MKDRWWRAMVHERDDIEGLDAAILMRPETWMASGHVSNFEDTLVDCKSCKKRFKAEHITGKKCPECGGELTEARLFNLMLKTHLGPIEDEGSLTYLRPETAQGIFLNFKNVVDSMRRKVPFGIAQTGKSFRNEVTTKSFTFRSREFEQMEIEFFVKPGTDEEWYRKWVDERFGWYVKFGIRSENLRKREHEKTELAHYAKACTDIEYKYPWGWDELEGVANRTSFDLTRHAEASGKKLQWMDPDTKEWITPHVVEPAAGSAVIRWITNEPATSRVNFGGSGYAVRPG